MDKKNTIKVYTTSNNGELSISAPSTKQVISATNNRAQYFAEQAKKYRDEAKLHRDNAKYYAEQNSDVTFEYINNVRASLEDKIAEKQDLGNYALKEEIPINVSELVNDAEYINQDEFNTTIEEIKLPLQENCEGKFLMSDGKNANWVGINTFQLFDIKTTDSILTYEESKGWALQGTYVYKEAIAGSRYGYPDFYNKCLQEYNEATNTETINGVTIKVHTNGHKFYDIANKSSIDNFFNTMGYAWFYGIDQENERIFLPRNKYLTSYITDGTKSISVCGNGSPLGLTTGGYNPDNTAFQTLTHTSPYGFAPVGYTSPQTLPLTNTNVKSYSNSVYGVTANPSLSGLTGSLNLQNTSNNQYVYICVGNTTNYEGMSDVVNQGMDILEQVNQGLELKTNKNEVDGQWIPTDETNYQIHSASSTAVGAYILDISELLPNDGYCYEILGHAYMNTSTATMTYMNVSSSLIYGWLHVGVTRNDYAKYVASSFVLPIGTDRKFTYQITGGAVSTNYITMVAYRRIGTNQ